MPIYEFSCQNCGQKFDKLCSVNTDEKEIICPECGTKECKRELSIFGYKGEGGSSATSTGCGSCSVTNCGTCGH